MLIGSIGIVVYGQVLDGARIGLYLFLIMAITAAILYLALRKEVAQWVTTRLPRYLGNTVGTALEKIYSSLLAYQEYPGALVKCFLLGLLMQFTRVLIAWTMAIALGIEIPFIYYFMFIPVSMILIMIPVSVGGFGVREGVLVVLFSLAGFSTTDAFALGFAISLTDMVSSLFGGLIYLLVKFPVADSNGERPASTIVTAAPGTINSVQVTQESDNAAEFPLVLPDPSSPEYYAVLGCPATCRLARRPANADNYKWRLAGAPLFLPLD